LRQCTHSGRSGRTETYINLFAFGTEQTNPAFYLRTADTPQGQRAVQFGQATVLIRPFLEGKKTE